MYILVCHLGAPEEVLEEKETTYYPAPPISFPKNLDSYRYVCEI